MLVATTESQREREREGGREGGREREVVNKDTYIHTNSQRTGSSPLVNIVSTSFLSLLLIPA